MAPATLRGYFINNLTALDQIRLLALTSGSALALIKKIAQIGPYHTYVHMRCLNMNEIAFEI